MAAQQTNPHAVLHHPRSKAGVDRHRVGKGRTMSKKEPERKRKLKRKSPPEAHAPLRREEAESTALPTWSPAEEICGVFCECLPGWTLA